MKRPFREHHLLLAFAEYEKQTKPLDAFLRNYFHTNKSVGSHDRKIICENIYGIIRWQGLLDYLSESPHSWEKRYNAFKNFDPSKYQEDDAISQHVKVSFPKVYHEKIVQYYGKEKGAELCLISNTKAPVTIRVNLLKISRDELLKKWQNTYDVAPCSESPTGIVFKDKINFFSLPEFKAGLFEVQDEGSQMIADLVNAKKGDQVLDFCAGSGGKTLAFAHKLSGGGQIYLHDIRDKALEEAKMRLKRAGIQNAQIVTNERLNDRILPPMDWILLDVPCSGSGTLRRNPDLKWRFDFTTFENLKEQQRAIFDRAIKLLKKGGKIVYSTCSIFPEENELQIDFFIKQYNLSLALPPTSLLPTVDGGDGFFGAVLKNN